MGRKFEYKYDIARALYYAGIGPSVANQLCRAGDHIDK